MKKVFIFITIIVSLSLTACASFEEFSAQYDKVDIYLDSDGDYVYSINELYSDWLLGEWLYDSKTYSVSMPANVLQEESTAEVLITDYANDANISVDGSMVSLASFLNSNFSDKEEKGSNVIHIIKISSNQSKISMGKLELASDGVSEFITIRTLTRVESDIYFNIRFDSKGGSSIPLSTIQLGEKITEPTAPTKDAYIFKGWTLNDSLYDFNIRPSANITLSALWEKIPVDATVTFDSAGGSSVANQIVHIGYKAAEPKAPVKENYVFDYWTLNNTIYDFNQEVKNNITLTASYSPIIYEEDFFETRFYYSQCKDVQWNVSSSEINLSGPQMLYSAQKGNILSESIFDDGAYIKFDETDQEGYYSQNLYSKNGDLLEVLSNKGLITYFGEYGFLYQADIESNNTYKNFCSYFYTKKALNKDGSTPERASYPFTIEIVKDLEMLNNFN